MGAGCGGDAGAGRTAAAVWLTLEPAAVPVAGEPSAAGGVLSGAAGAELATGRRSAPYAGNEPGGGGVDVGPGFGAAGWAGIGGSGGGLDAAGGAGGTAGFPAGIGEFQSPAPAAGAVCGDAGADGGATGGGGGSALPAGGIVPAPSPSIKLVGGRPAAEPVCGATGLIGIAGVPEVGTPPMPDIPGLGIDGGATGGADVAGPRAVGDIDCDVDGGMGLLPVTCVTGDAEGVGVGAAALAPSCATGGAMEAGAGACGLAPSCATNSPKDSGDTGFVGGGGAAGVGAAGGVRPGGTVT